MKQKWLRLSTFCEKYKIQEATITVAKSTGILPSHIFRTVELDFMQIDEAWYIRRKEFRMKVRNRIHDLYYFLTEHFSLSDVAREVVKYRKGNVNYSSIVMYFNQDLFMEAPETLHAIKLTPNMWAMYRYWWAIERRLRRRGASIAKVLDRRTYD